jgi:hypothetical protein
MIQEFVDRFMAKMGEISSVFEEKHPEEYKDVVRAVISALHDPDSYRSIDPNRIHQIDDGNHQGTLVFIIAESGYQPDDYWYVKVSYGSCSGCDTLQSIRGYGDEKPTAKQVADYMTLALHVVQGIKKMDDDFS